MKTNSKFFYYFISWTCIFICVADFFVTYELGEHFPNYSQMGDSISKLGSAISPVAFYTSTWWVFIGAVFILFGISFRKVYPENGKAVIFASWLIIIYGLGEGFGSGLFQANHIGDKLSLSCKIHDSLGGIGIAAILILPLALRKVFRRIEHPFMFHFSMVVLILGLTMFVLFTLAKISGFANNIFEVYFGLWQRLLTIVIYSNLVAIGIMMMKKLRVVS